MTMRLTPTVVRAAYEFLRQTEPFRRWHLPPGNKITFTVMRSQNNHGFHLHDGKKHEIQVSCRTIGSCLTLIETVAHEMCHVRQAQKGMETDHGPAFRRMARQVCKRHGFDSKSL
jgi:hypothetical protein